MRPFLSWQLRLGKTFLPPSLLGPCIIALQDETGLHNGREVLCSGKSILGLGAASDQFVSRLFPILLSTAWEADPQVWSNAIFRLGVLADHRGFPTQEYFPKLVSLLLTLLASEHHDRVHGICRALTHLLMASPTRKQSPRYWLSCHTPCH